MTRLRQVGDWVLLHRAGIVLAASLLALAYAGYTGIRSGEARDELREFVECQAEYNEVNNERTRALAKAADQERAAERRTDAAERLLFTDPILSIPAGQRSPQDQAKINDLFREYQASLIALETERADADKARAEHPVPEPPSKRCGDT